jgi:hypothetical protein
MKPINLSRPASLIWSFGFFICLICVCIFFYILNQNTFPAIHTPINLISISLDYWFFSIPLGIVYILFIIRYYRVIQKKYKSSRKEYLSIITTILTFLLFPTILISASLLVMTSSYLSFIPVGVIIFGIILTNILKNIKQTSF